MSGFTLVHREIDVAAHRRDGLRLEYVHRRGADEEWHVAEGPVEFQSPLTWGLARSGDAVLIPLVPYVLHRDANQAAAWLLAAGIKVGTEVKARYGVRSLVMVTGDPPEDLGPEGNPGFTRLHVGFAIQVR